jgi:CheY-like chemotaxis protein
VSKKPFPIWSRRPRVLVVEDEYLIADMLQTMLEELGCEVLGPVSSVKDAKTACQTLQMDAAIVDLVLNGERADPVADALKIKGIPFGYATGMPAEGAKGNWKDHPFLIPKPYTKEQLAAALAAILGDRDGRERPP